MIRFKLRTLLLLTAIIAAVAGYYGHRISTLTQGARAYEKLAEHWAVGINETPYGHSEIVYAKSEFQNFIDWPVRKFLENDHRTIEWDIADNIYSLWLYDNAAKEKKSLEGIEYFRNITELKLYYSPALSSGITIEDNEFCRIAKLKNLEELLIHGCQVSAKGISHLRGLNLHYLQCGTEKWGARELDEIGNLSSLRELTIYCKSFDAERIQNLQELKTLSAYLSTTASLNGIENLPKLERLVLGGIVCDSQLAPLKNAEGLKQVSFHYARFEGDCIDKLLEAPTIENVEFVNCWANVKKLEDAGITIEKVVESN